jgi:phosphatidylglycerophosphate synthase
MTSPEPEISRRPLKTRGTRWAASAARCVVAIGLRPNQISVLSVFFAALACGCLVLTNHVEGTSVAWLFLGAAAGIQLRLLCNMLDGMVAVEGGFRTSSGEIYNELPDRFADALILAGAGYSLGSSPTLTALGWAAAVGALITAYVRALGVAAGASQYFLGPMAKPHRMAVLTAACLGTAILLAAQKPYSLIQLALWVIVIGCAITAIRRTIRIVRELEAK